MDHQSCYCRRHSLQYKLHKTRTVHILSFFPPFTSLLHSFIFQQCIKLLCTQLMGSQEPFLHHFRQECMLLSPRRKSPPPHTHTHTQSQAGQVSLKITLSFRFRVQKFLPDWQRRVFYAHFYFGYVEQEKNCPVTCPLIYVPLRRL